MENQARGKLRVGLLLDSFQVPAWAYVMLQRIRDSSYAEIDLVVLNGAFGKEKGSLLSRLARQRRFLLYEAYRELDRRVLRVKPDAMEILDAAGLLAGVPVLKVRPREGAYSDWIEEADVEAIRGYRLDVLIRRGFRILRGKVLEAARFGVWSFHHGDVKTRRGAPAGFWNVFENHPVTGSALQVLTEEMDGGAVLCRSYSATDYLSVARNVNNYYWKTLSFIPRKLRELHDRGEKAFFEKVRAENQHPDFYSHRLYQRPSNGEMAALLAKHAAKVAWVRLNHALFLEQWVLMFDLGDRLRGTFRRFRRIVPPRDRFWADPHIVYKDGRYYIFIEEFLYRQGRAHIAVLVMDEAGNYSPPVKVLEKPYHLSYPFVFEWQGACYMVPESSANRTIEAYRCTSFPDRWEPHATLMQGVQAMDATLFPHGGKWWLFANMAGNEGASTWDELFLFHADNPLSQRWTPHPLNPIVSDVQRSRPAGPLFTHGGNLYRPSQDSSRRYGYGLRMNQVLVLNETDYQEKEVAFIEPKWAPDVRGVHTFGHQGRLTVIDAVVKRRRWP